MKTASSVLHLIALSEAASSLTSSLKTQLSTELQLQAATTNGAKNGADGLVVGFPLEDWGEILHTLRRSNATIKAIELQPKMNGETTNASSETVEMLVQFDLPLSSEQCLTMATQLMKSHDHSEVKLLLEGKEVAMKSRKTDENSNWFPRSPADLDTVANRVLLLDQLNDVDHPSMQDRQYQERRRMFAELAFDYKHDQPIPLVSYTDEENATWSTVFNRLCELYDTHACKEFLENFKQLRDIGLYRSDRIPQLRDVSDFVRRRSGFTLRPVAGYLSARDFLSALALRVFCCTQYIRHSEKPFYTPEPDCCHELLGHVPMLADAGFAHFSQEIGLASLGASDDDVQKLATCYFFTVEFGLCKEAGQFKVYGAGLLSCVDELAHSVSPEATIAEFEPDTVVKQECRITTFQDGYFYTNSFSDAIAKIRQFTQAIKRTDQLVYNPFTQSIESVSSLLDLGRLFDRVSLDLDAGQRLLKTLAAC